ncbi:MAG: AMP-binding protein [Pseudomonadota bacterium]
MSQAPPPEGHLAYDQVCAQFRWERPAHYNFVGDTIAHWASTQPDAVALHWVDGDGNAVIRTFAELRDDAARAASVLATLGLTRGDAVLLILSREQRWWELMLGCLQLGVVVSPGTIQLKAKDIAYRLQAAKARAVITNAAVAPEVDAALEQVAWQGARVSLSAELAAGWQAYEALRAEATPAPSAADTPADAPALCYFTSGTTGQPKLTVHRHDYPLGHQATGQHWLQATPGSLIWNLSDTGWAKAAWSSLFAPWLAGAGVFALHADAFDGEQILATLAERPITTLCAPPTIYRLFVRSGQLAADDFHSLRHCVSAGEPLNAEVIALWKQQTGLDIYEGYGQTETILLCANFPGVPIRQGSMGVAAPGVDLQVIDEAGAILPSGTEGDIAVNLHPDAKPQGMFLGYQDDEARTASTRRGAWYLTGDRAVRDDDGYFWFVGRADDVILSSGYRIGPFEVESVLFEHPAVAESAVVASPDPTRGEVVKAFVVLAPGHEASDALVQTLQKHVKSATAPYKYPRKIEFVSELPKTISGKIKRKELKAKEWADTG